MTNLFSIFDPYSNMLINNWIIMYMYMMFMSKKFWLKKNKNMLLLTKINKSINMEFMNLVSKMKYILLIINTLFIFIMINNLLSLLPYIYTLTSQMSTSMTLSITMWSACFMFMWKKNTKKTLIHLIPNNTPYMLMPFMVLIETISNLIRPLTLSIRLTANMIAGHLLLILIANTMEKMNIITMTFLFVPQTLLMMLELAVSMIQAYVMSILVTMYNEEII